MEGGQQTPTKQNFLQKAQCKFGLHRWEFSKTITSFDKNKQNPRQVELYLCRNNCYKTKIIE